MGAIDNMVTLDKAEVPRRQRSPLLLQGAPVQCVPVSPMSTAMTLAAPAADVEVANGVQRGREASGQP